MKILVVDDDQGTINALSAGLSSFGHQVVVAENGPQALEALKGEPLDLIVSDLKMPGMSGLDLIRSAKELRPGFPCILMTAFGNSEVRQAAQSLGLCGYIEKPFTPESLLSVIEALGNGPAKKP